MSGNITSADISASMTVDNLYTSAQTLAGFAADNIFDANSLELAQTVMGADGTLSAGYVYAPVDQTWHIMPDSDSYTIFQDWAKYSRSALTVYRCNMTITFAANGSKYTLSNGVLVNANIIPSAGRVLQPITALIRWESVTPSSYSA